MRKRNHRRQARQRWPQFSILDEMAADPIQPLAKTRRDAQLSAMRQALANLENGENPTPNDWRVCSDAVNITETLVREMGVAEDADGLLADAVAGMAEAAQRYLQGKNLRLSGPGLHAIRSVLEDYEMMISELPARVVIRAHRLTERRVRDILEHHAQGHDVMIVGVKN